MVVEVAVVVMMVVVAVVWMQKNVNIQSCSFPNVKNTQNIKFLQIQRMHFRRMDGPTDQWTNRWMDQPTNQWMDKPSYRDARTHLISNYRVFLLK